MHPFALRDVLETLITLRLDVAGLEESRGFYAFLGGCRFRSIFWRNGWECDMCVCENI